MAAPRAMAFPFGIDALGRVAFTEDPTEQTRDQVRMVLGTRLNTRVMSARYGTDMQAYVFGHDDEIAHSQLQHEVEQALATWMPQVEVVDVTQQSVDQEGVIAVRVDYSLPNSTPQDSTVYSAVIQIGGTVVAS